LSASVSAATGPGEGERPLLGHPRGLAVLVATEIWEQFSYYGMRALLIYYMISTLGFSQPSASLIYASYVAAAYFTPIVGGILADRWLGRRHAVTLGSLFMAAGHLILAWEPAFFVALALIALGNGLYVPSIASQIGGLYRAGDARQKTAFSIYYMGGNVGGFLAPLACGYLGETYGWHWGFGLAGIGMLVGLAIYVAGERHLPQSTPQRLVEMDSAPNGKGVLPLLLAVLAVVILFRAAYEQLGNTVALWIESADRGLGDLVIPMTWFQSLNGLLVILLTPLLLAWWHRRSRLASSGRRMAAGAGLVALAYLLAAALSFLAEAEQTAVAWPWILLFFFLITAGELHILPVGLGLFGRLAPRRIAASVMAIWFAAISAGSFLSGIIGAFWSSLPAGHFFLLTASVAGAAALLCLALSGWIARTEEERGA
jgi:amino acid/peptide transporter (Peptide:H+ symporter), bacterial